MEEALEGETRATAEAEAREGSMVDSRCFSPCRFSSLLTCPPRAFAFFFSSFTASPSRLMTHPSSRHRTPLSKHYYLTSIYCKPGTCVDLAYCSARMTMADLLSALSEVPLTPFTVVRPTSYEKPSKLNVTFCESIVHSQPASLLVLIPRSRLFQRSL
jgi:hypothetical protein